MFLKNGKHVLLLMAVAEYFSIDPVWFLIVWYLSDNISA